MAIKFELFVVIVLCSLWLWCLGMAVLHWSLVKDRPPLTPDDSKKEGLSVQYHSGKPGTKQHTFFMEHPAPFLWQRQPHTTLPLISPTSIQ